MPDITPARVTQLARKRLFARSCPAASISAGSRIRARLALNRARADSANTQQGFRAAVRGDE
jgi:hypothetical protein